MNRPAESIATHFEAPGSLPRPKMVGRAIRLGFGAMLLSGLYSMLTGGLSLFSLQVAPRSASFWIFVAIAAHLTPYVINIGFGTDWRRKPQVAVAIAVAVLVGIDVVVYGTWWAPPLGGFVWLWLVYFSTHLGLSFVLSALLGTPGCEMRAIPHLWTLLTGQATHEHYCPGPLDRIDKWETGGRTSP